MVAYVKINDFAEAVALGIHNLSTGSLRLALSNTAPGSDRWDRHRGSDRQIGRAHV